MNSLNEFVFRALLTRRAIAEMQDGGVLRAPSLTPQERRDHDLLAPIAEKIRLSSFHMQRCYRLLFVFENLIRDFIADTLGEIDGPEWFDKRASAEMKRRYADRREKELRNQWHTGRNEHPVFYLDFGDLGLLIVNHWAEFKDFFDSQAWVTSRIQEAERTRNVIAHTNVLASEEVDRLGIYLRDWIRQIG